MATTSIYWFRKALRVHDNEGLLAVSKSQAPHLCLFILDPHFSTQARVGIRRWAHLFETLSDLNQSLVETGSRLVVVRSQPMRVLEFIKSQREISLHFEEDFEPYARQRDREVSELIPVTRYHGHLLFHPETVIQRNKNKAPTQYQSFLKAVDGLVVPECHPKPDRFRSGVDSDLLDALKKWNSNCAGPNGDFGVPTLEEIGKIDTPEGHTRHLGGESEALKRLDAFLSNDVQTAKFEKPKTSPAAFQPASTTVLSPYLKFGSLSCRLFYHRVQDILKRQKQHSKPPTSLIGQLLWRDFYYCVASATPNFHKMLGNPICIQNEWKCQTVEEAEIDTAFQAWKNAQTGFPWIDAIMTQLRQEGWIHHLARHSVACFLTRGDLYISWERGQEVFEEWLLDADWALNAGNWMWLSASAFFYQYFRVYSPIVFGQKYDPRGEYIKRYLPQLERVPKEYIYEPWKMPKDVQKRVDCIIGVDYPMPIVDHDIARNACLASMKKAYDARSSGSAGTTKTSSSLKDSKASPKKSAKDAKHAKRKQPSIDKWATSKRSKD